MENRLTDFALVAGLDAGHQNLPWDPGQMSGLLAGLDLQAIMADPEAATVVPLLPVQPLYYALKQKGFEESLDILPLLSEEQVVRMVDYDVWSHDRLVPQKLFRFLKPFGDVSSEELFRRFSELDEEYQLAALQGMFRVYEVESIYDLSEDLQDRVREMPCHTIFYEIIAEEAEDIEFADNLMEACKQHNLRYAYGLLGHAAYMPPGEQEQQIAHFRKARLEEDGFISYQESLELFSAIDLEALRVKWPVDSRPGLTPAVSAQGFLDRVMQTAREQGTDIDELYTIHQGQLYLANALCAAARVEPQDAHGIHRLLEQGKALASLGLEYLAQGQIEAGVSIVRGETPKTLFKVGMSLIDGLRAAVVRKMCGLGLPGSELLERLYQTRQWGKILLELERNWSDRVGLQSNEILKGLFNRFPMYPLEDQARRIIFRPIDGLQAFRELRLSLATLLGTFASTVRSGMPLTQSFELVLREAAIQSLAQGARGSYVQLEEAIPQLLEAWRDGLRAEQERWYVGDAEDLDEVLNLVSETIHAGLHGLIILPKKTGHEEALGDR